MSDFKTRLLEERDQLQEKVEKLDKFLDSSMYETISERQQVLLVDQLESMEDYLYYLNERIEDLDNN
jgi:hypothetical protein